MYDGLRDIETVLTADQIREIDTLIGGPKEVSA
jgi:manganese/zinc/iron transport system permease protein